MYINIDNLLHEKKVSRMYLAKIVGCNYSSLSNLCNNKTSSVHLQLLEKICIALNVGVEDVLIVEKKRE